jgi:hypothetical protein
MNQSHLLISQLENYLVFKNTEKTTVSSSNVGWHIQHSLLVIIKIIESVQQSDPLKFKREFNLNRIIVFAMNGFPRGKAKAPASVLPEEIITEETIIQTMEKANKALAQLSECAPNQYFVHPYFGKLNVKGTHKILKIHTHHHIKIIKDIITYSPE